MHRLRALYHLVVGADIFGKTLNCVGLVLSFASIAAGMFLGNGAALPWWLGLAIGVPISVGATLWTVMGRILALEAERAPRLEFGQVFETRRSWHLYGTKRTFEITLTSSTMLEECVVYLTRMAAHDGTDPVDDHLPKPLLTRENNRRGGEGRFRIRAGQSKHIVICSRVDGDPSELDFAFEGEHEPVWSFSLGHTKDITITLSAYSEGPKQEATIRLRVNASGHLSMERENAIGDQRI